jgi:hypothetical protein
LGHAKPVGHLLLREPGGFAQSAQALAEGRSLASGWSASWHVINITRRKNI